MEGRVRVGAVRARVRERPDDVEELRDGPRPAVRENERQGARLGRADMEEVDPLPVDVGGELRVSVEGPLPDAPVVAGAPVLHERPKDGERHAVIPAGVGDLLREARAAQPLGEIVEISLRNGDAVGIHRRSRYYRLPTDRRSKPGRGRRVRPCHQDDNRPSDSRWLLIDVAEDAVNWRRFDHSSSVSPIVVEIRLARIVFLQLLLDLIQRRES